MATLVILRRELRSLWATPLAWVVLTVFLCLQGVAFSSVLTSLLTLTDLHLDTGPTQAYYGQSVFVPLGLLLLCPVLTMKSFAEERRSGTIEVLLSAPVDACHIVLGKFLAIHLSFCMFWLPTLVYPVTLRGTGQIEWSVISCTYLTLFGIGGGMLAFGLLTSALSRNQLIAATLSGAFVFGLILLGILDHVVLEGPLSPLLAHVSLQRQLEEGSRGILSLSRAVFDLTLIGVPLFITTRLVDRWRTAP